MDASGSGSSGTFTLQVTKNRASNGNRIEGTPTARGPFTFNLTVRDQDGQQATQVTSITIN